MFTYNPSMAILKPTFDLIDTEHLKAYIKYLHFKYVSVYFVHLFKLKIISDLLTLLVKSEKLDLVHINGVLMLCLLFQNARQQLSWFIPLFTLGMPTSLYR